MNKLSACVSVDSYMIATCNADMIEKYVKDKLTYQIGEELSKTMTIVKTYDPKADTYNYGTTISIGTPNGISHGSIGSAVSTSSYSQINLRVVEYTKNGKTTRVELQKYDDHDNQWCKIPRIQIEE